MREKWARVIAYLTGLVVLLLAAFFAFLQNPVTIQSILNDAPQIDKVKQPGMQKELSGLDMQRITLGQSVYQQQGCSLCHSINGQGNPRYPLDNVGLNRSVKDIRAWIIAEAEIQGQLSARVFSLKQRHRQLTDQELESLIYYLRSLENL